MALNTLINGQNSGMQLLQNHGQIMLSFYVRSIINSTIVTPDLPTELVNDQLKSESKIPMEASSETNLYRWILDSKEFKEWQGSQGNDRLL
ncbi:YVTN repeat-like/Quino protein amine dehydrogenase [Penicillium longicatenatum]|nr:YVTN repeat-like/Quino protein amine dehydrogenase [Penicillium longicatenatum]